MAKRGGNQRGFWRFAESAGALAGHVRRFGAAMLLLLANSAGAQVVLVGDSISVALVNSGELPPGVMVLAGSGQRVEGAQYVVPGAVAFMGGNSPRPSLARVVLFLGTNDWYFQTDPARFRLALEQTVGGLRVPVVCILPLPRQDEAQRPIPLEAYRDVLRSVCPAVRDARQAIPEWSAELFADAVHPNAAGLARLAAWLAQNP